MILEPALHLVELKHYAAVESVANAAESAWTMHEVSATECDVKTTTATYAKSVNVFGEFAAAPSSQRHGGVVVFMNRYMMATFMCSEQACRWWTFSRHGAVNFDASGSESDVDEDDRGGGGDDADGDDDEDVLEEGEGGHGGARAASVATAAVGASETARASQIEKRAAMNWNSEAERACSPWSPPTA